jgi:hypothetical protein
MTLTNRDVFVQDPSAQDIPNLGVAKVGKPEDDNDWATLAWELKSFVCEGEYERGLERILGQYLSHLTQTEQPAAWVSGFYGSGKSHLMRVLEYLWVNPTMPGGESARGLATLPSDITDHLAELSTVGKREGGVWSAAGTLGAGAAGSVRLAFLNVIFDSADLPQQLGPARLAIWMRQQGIHDQVATAVEAAGKEFLNELRNLYVSPVLAQALIDAGAAFGTTPAEVSKALQSQFTSPSDITDEEMLETFEEVLRLQSDTEGKLPLTLVVLDEMQQYINEDNSKALLVQNLVEACSKGFNGQVLIVATGQAALTANPTLQKLVDRFTVQVALSDTDVENVVREVILRKKPDQTAAIDKRLGSVSGEIDKHLGGTRIEAKAADRSDWVADYPLLPTRRRFWEEALRRIDKAGKAGVLRTQLKIVHDAAASVADEPLGHVIGGDYIFRSESATMLQSGVLLKEIDELIRGLDDGTADGRLKSRAASLIFLISQLPQDGFGDIGLRATAPMIADLLVEDLEKDGAPMRRDVPIALQQLADDGKLLKIGEEYRLQTEEGEEWTKAFNQQRSAVRDDPTRMSSLRNEWLLQKIDIELKGLKLLHGNSKTPRKISTHWNDDEPTPGGDAVQVWIRDEWQTNESSVKNAAAQRGNEDPTVHVLLPKVDADGIRDALAAYAASNDTIQQRPEPQTDGGREAKRGMESRRVEGEARLGHLFDTVLANARVFQSGGNELTSNSLRSSIETAANNSLVRLFPKFTPADNEHWGKVLDQARDGAPDALKAVGHDGDALSHPVCKEVFERISGAGTAGSDVQRDMGGPPYGWPADAINGALMALLADGNIRAEQDGKPLAGPKQLPKTQIGKARFFKEDEPPTMQERLAVRGLLGDAKVEYVTGNEGPSISGGLQRLIDAASSAGGEAPLPEPPSTAHIVELAHLAGNEQFRAVAKVSEVLRGELAQWTTAASAKADREVAWGHLDRLLRQAASLDVTAESSTQRDAIVAERQLLNDPDPVKPLKDKLCDALRDALTTEIEEYSNAYTVALAEIFAADAWSKIDSVDQQALLVVNGLVSQEAPDISTDELLLVALDSAPLSAWQDRRQAIPAKADDVRKAAAEKLEAEAVSVKPASGTLRTEADADEYVAELKSQVMAHIADGKIVII